MAESKPSKFWGDAARKTGNVLGWSALVLPASEWIEDALGQWGQTGGVWHHILAVALVAAIRAVVALVQGKVGDPDKASFASAASDGDDPDDG